mgnify:CR=1 FL=1
MNVSVKRKIETVEPVQWAIDFLEKMIDLHSEEDLETYCWEKLLKEKKRELLEDFYALTPSFVSFYRGLGYCEGLDGGRILVMRILMGALPPYRALGYCSGERAVGITSQIKTFKEIIVYLKTLHLTAGDDRELWKKSFFYAVEMLLRSSYSPYFFHRGGRPALVIATPYHENTAACYLSNPHVIVLYRLPEKNIAKRIFLILHEIGHLIFNKYIAGKPLPDIFATMLAGMKSQDYPGLICPSSQGITEIFANLFAMAIMHGTAEGDELFHKHYSKMGETTFLLRESFNPFSIFQNAAKTLP